MITRPGLPAALAIGVCIASVVSTHIAAAAPAQARIVGAVRINDPGLRAREGLLLRDQPAPRLAPERLLRALTDYGSLLPDPRGGLVLLGRYGWVYAGRDVAHLRTVGWGLSTGYGGGTPFLLADGGWVVAGNPGLSDEDILGLAPDLSIRWSVPSGPTTVRPPVALAPDGTLYAVGGTPSVLDARTGQVLATLQDPAPSFSSPVVAPDGTLRVVGAPLQSLSTAPQTVYLYGYDRHGNQMWRTSLTEGSPDLTTTSPSIGPDGATYIESWQSTPTGHREAVLTAVGADGGVRWRMPVGRRVSRPAIDSRGYVWTMKRNGTAIAVDPSGRVAFQRSLLPASGFDNLTTVALGQGVLAEAGPIQAHLEARAGTATPTSARLTATPIATVAVEPLTCVAPPAGRPRTCIYPTTSGGLVEIRTPVDGTIRLAIRRAGRARILYRQGPYRVLAGDNRIRLDLVSGEVCDAFSPCVVPPGRYVVSVNVPLGAGRRRVMSAPVRVLAGSGWSIG